VHPIPAPADEPVEISVTVSNQPTAQWEQANLVWYYDAGNMVKLGQELVTGRLSIVMGREENDRARTIAIVPLDGYAVDLRLQAVQNRLRGQFRTAPWKDWRDVGECDLPVKGDPKASLQFYNGPAKEEHWIRVTRFQVRRLPASQIDWPRVRAEEKIHRASDAARTASSQLPLQANAMLVSDLSAVLAEPKPDCDHSLFKYRDGSFGWQWNRRAVSSKEPTVVGVSRQLGPVALADLKSLELDLNAVTRLDIDQGDHNFLAVLSLKPAGRVVIWFDWYGPASDVTSMSDGHREYGYVATPTRPNEAQYRIRGFRGAPPRVNLKAFLDDAVQRGAAASAEVAGLWLGNEAWNNSRGGTLVTQFELRVNGR
jgi:hypothetical protein